MTRQRADVVLTDRGFFSSRAKAKAAILAGEVRVDGEPLTKAGERIDPDALIEVAPRPRYVSRGGMKLAGALECFEVDVTGKRALDVGASTGGFTDCLLQAGAGSVVAVDVGYGQLAWSLRQDDRVTVHERTNIRHVDPQTLGAPFDMVVVDVSFIGLAKILPRLVEMMSPEGILLALVKPQFEAGKGNVGKRGVVRDARVHEDVLRKVFAHLDEQGLSLRGATWSPVKGPEGNIEFWVMADLSGDVAVDVDMTSLVREAHEELAR